MYICVWMSWDVKIWRSDHWGYSNPHLVLSRPPWSYRVRVLPICPGLMMNVQMDVSGTLTFGFFYTTGSVSLDCGFELFFSEHWTFDLVCMCWGEAGGERLEACSQTQSVGVNPALLNPVSKTPIPISLTRAEQLTT